MLIVFESTVFVEVGTDEVKQRFEVFQGVLSFYSGYFEAAFNGRWQEAQKHAVLLPEADPKIFELFEHWIYTRCFYESTLDPATLLDYVTLTKLWIFADVHDVPMLQNEVVDIMLRKMSESGGFIDEEAIYYIYENTVENSQLRRLTYECMHKLLTEAMALGGGASSSRPLRDSLSEIMGSLPGMDELQKAKSSNLRLTYRRIAGLDYRCQWHVHRDSVGCPTANPVKYVVELGRETEIRTESEIEGQPESDGELE